MFEFVDVEKALRIFRVNIFIAGVEPPKDTLWLQYKGKFESAGYYKLLLKRPILEIRHIYDWMKPPFTKNFME